MKNEVGNLIHYLLVSKYLDSIGHFSAIVELVCSNCCFHVGEPLRGQNVEGILWEMKFASGGMGVKSRKIFIGV